MVRKENGEEGWRDGGLATGVMVTAMLVLEGLPRGMVRVLEERVQGRVVEVVGSVQVGGEGKGIWVGKSMRRRELG